MAFDVTAEAYGRFMGRLSEPLAGQLADLARVTSGSGQRVVDVGCGPGALTAELVRRLGATYHHGTVEEAGPAPDIVLECTGVDSLVFAAIDRARANGVVCLTGVSSGSHVMSAVNLGSMAWRCSRLSGWRSRR